MKTIETNLLSLLTGNGLKEREAQNSDGLSGSSFSDILNSRLSEEYNRSGVDNYPLKRIDERNQSGTAYGSFENREIYAIEKRKNSEEITRGEEQPADNRIKGFGEEKKAEERGLIEESTVKEEKKTSSPAEKMNEKAGKKDEISEKREKMETFIENIEIENMEDPELKRFIKMLGKMIESINPLVENKPLNLNMKNILAKLQTLSENSLLKGKNPALKQAILKKLKAEIIRFTSLMKKAVEELEGRNSGLKKILTGINAMVQRIAEKGRGPVAQHLLPHGTVRGQDADNTMAVLNKIESLISEAVKENSSGSFESGDDKEGMNRSAMNFMKNFSGRQISENGGSTNNNQRFSRQMQNIIENAKVVVKDSRNGSFTVRLHPKQLGTVNVNLGLEQGVINGKFFVENHEARDLLMDNLHLIREQLEEAGINIGEFEVNVNHQGGMFSRDEPEETFFTVPGSGVEVTKEYRINTQLFHDGELNMII